MTRGREDTPMNGHATAALAVTAGLAVSAYINHRKAHRAEEQTARLHRENPGSTYGLLPEAGHSRCATGGPKHGPAIKAKPQAASTYSI